MYAMRLSDDLKQAVGRPVFLFSATDAPWVRDLAASEPKGKDQRRYLFPVYVTDGPFLYRLKEGLLLMLWSSLGEQGYAMGIARSTSGNVAGPWVQESKPVWGKDGGHGMFFRTFDGRLLLTLHAPNNTPNERAHFHELTVEGGCLSLKQLA
jgi:hypothetical protein